MDYDALDRWITGGRYTSEYIYVTCRGCEENTLVHSETEYGATDWSVDSCEVCGKPFNGDEETFYAEYEEEYDSSEPPDPPDEW